MALFNVSGRSAEGYRLWYDFSARSVKFNALEVAYLWHSTFVKSDYTMGTLHFFAKRDDPIAFNLYTSEKNVTIVDGERRDAQTMTNMDIARLLHNEYGDEFVCTKLSNPSRWFQFKDHRWQETEGGNELRKRISDENAVVVTTLNAADSSCRTFTRSART